MVTDMEHFRFSASLSSPDDLTAQIDLVRDCYRAETSQGVLITQAVVILPRAIHGLWSVAPGDNPARRLSRIMGGITSHSPSTPAWSRPQLSNVAEELLTDAIDAVLWEPVLSELSDTPEGWPYSSIHRKDRRLAS
ncbi:MAG: hypothetical protein ACU0DW_14445 [Shimia sp.]